MDSSQHRPHSQGNKSVADPVGADRDHADDRETTSVGLGAEEVHVGDLLGRFFVGEGGDDLGELVLNEGVVDLPVGVILGQDRLGLVILANANEPLRAP
jgi:hypothetical protein